MVRVVAVFAGACWLYNVALPVRASGCRAWIANTFHLSVQIRTLPERTSADEKWVSRVPMVHIQVSARSGHHHADERRCVSACGRLKSHLLRRVRRRCGV